MHPNCVYRCISMMLYQYDITAATTVHCVYVNMQSDTVGHYSSNHHIYIYIYVNMEYDAVWHYSSNHCMYVNIQFRAVWHYK